MALQEWKKRRQLKSKIAHANRSMDNSMNDFEKFRVHSEERSLLKLQFDIDETYRLVNKTRELGIELPDKANEEWWITPKVEFGYPLLTDAGQIRAMKLIRDERINTFKRLAELLIPILSLIVAILALLR